jgi:hypothetical protein
MILRHWLRNSEIRRFGSDDEDLQELYKNVDNNLFEAFETVDDYNFLINNSERNKAFNMNLYYKWISDNQE